ncbi:hypothetical protein Poli38472_004711 [Pythium oligandrum]|uniref:Crinkler effector protein N-terminal domain-containing protein n=1 Tax=Pythium oligandrum TaxID=41045 RepID=A0A8K1FHD9_PYTOL|nr:hypothetical protein Poli38472_004711 [Pythium oligandrum]|eukprot:TMW59642.1 hypothetical protein Poli38472_004711 [Pythium oligandrum]
MVDVTIVCGVYGEGAVVPVTVSTDAKVSDLRDAIYYKKRYNKQYKFDSSALTLYLARKDQTTWMKDDQSVKSFLQGGVSTEYEEMRPTWKLSKAELFGSFELGDENIHVLVELPPNTVSRQQAGLWLVRGSILDALGTKGIRCRVYRLAGAYIGYYDPSRRISDNDSAIWYEDTTLHIHVLFESKGKAMGFDNALQDEPTTIGSPLRSHGVTTSVARVDAVSTDLRRVYYVHYNPQESESPQDTVSSISLTSEVTVVDASTDQFQYQRIEHERYFLPYGKAESCHLVSKKQTREHKREFGHYDRDMNNRLALSREMHGYYDALSYEVPIVNISPGSVVNHRTIGNRYKVEIFVEVLDGQCKDRVFSRLKDGSERTSDPLVWKTFVYVENPETFCFCLRWKHADNAERWSSYLSTTPAVD